MSSRSKIILTLILIATFFVRIPSFFEPWWYADEGISGAVAQAINSGRLLYADVFDNKPPATYLFFAAVFKIFGPSLGAVHFLTTLMVTASQIGIFLLGRKINQAAGLGASALLGLLLATPLLEGNSTNGEILMIGPIILGLVIGWESLTKKSLGTRDKLLLVGSGLCFGVGMMFKFPGIFDFAAFLVLLLLGLGSLKVKMSKLAWALGGFIIPYSVGAVYFLSTGHLGDYLRSTFLGNISYVGYGNFFIIPQGLLVVKAIPVVLLLFLVVRRRDLFFRYPLLWAGLIWFGFATYGALLGGRPYNHYFIQAVPALSLVLAGLVWGEFKYRHYALTLSALALLLLTWHFSRTAYLSPSYYSNFLSYAADRKSEGEYRNNFDSFVDRDYKVAEYLRTSTTPGEPVLVWSNNAQIYVLSDLLPVSRYVASYLAVRIARDEDEVVRSTGRHKPKFIVVAPSEPLPMGLVQIINDDYREEITIRDATIYRLR